jgi:hypothetical protein
MKLKNIISLINKLKLPKELLYMIIDYSGIMKDYYSDNVLSHLILYKKDTFGGFNYNSLYEFHNIRELYTYFVNNLNIDKYNPVTIEKNYYAHDNSTNYLICFKPSWVNVY